MDEMTLTLNSPITEEQWDALTDVDFDNTNEIYFRTKHGKKVYFVKRKTGKWICSDDLYETAVCSCCGWDTTEPWQHIKSWFEFCPHCGTDMRGGNRLLT